MSSSRKKRKIEEVFEDLDEPIITSDPKRQKIQEELYLEQNNDMLGPWTCKACTFAHIDKPDGICEICQTNNYEIESEIKDNNNNNNNNKDIDNDDAEIYALLNNMDNNIISFPHFDSSRIDIRTLKDGDGKTYPDSLSAVELKYTGYLYDANKTWKKFTSKNISSTVFVTRLGNYENIHGLEQGVLSMSKGEIIALWIPSRLGYGTYGAKPLIPPNTDLLFKITLVGVLTENEEEEEEECEEFVSEENIKIHSNQICMTFGTTFNNEWNQRSFDNVFNAIKTVEYLREYPMEILIFISHFAMDQLFPHNDRSRIDVRTLTNGDGITYCTPFDSVKLEYTGWRYKYDKDGKWEIFASKEQLQTTLGNWENIIGLEQAILSMSKNESVRVWIPSRLGYGTYGAKPLISPDMDLIFEITLIQIKNEDEVDKDTNDMERCN